DISASLGGDEKTPKDKGPSGAKRSENVNLGIYIGKCGFEWRRLQLINPIIYVALVQLLTTKEKWGVLMNKSK
ncbi:MAG: hypothetical protein IJT08_02890, partial [Alphaproteobacteria bacterium]|nr:hypothetical protein [Alphaproteobacteria bacterium]